MIGPGYVYELAKQKMGNAAESWMNTRVVDIPLLEPDEWWGTPRDLLESGCPSCVNTVLEAVEKL